MQKLDDLFLILQELDVKLGFFVYLLGRLIIVVRQLFSQSLDIKRQLDVGVIRVSIYRFCLGDSRREKM